jgi:hypothetical protein
MRKMSKYHKTDIGAELSKKHISARGTSVLAESAERKKIVSYLDPSSHVPFTAPFALSYVVLMHLCIYTLYSAMRSIRTHPFLSHS